MCLTDKKNEILLKKYKLNKNIIFENNYYINNTYNNNKPG